MTEDRAYVYTKIDNEVILQKGNRFHIISKRDYDILGKSGFSNTDMFTTYCKTHSKEWIDAYIDLKKIKDN